MKKLLLLMFALGQAVVAMAESYTPLVREGVRWECDIYKGNLTECTTQPYSIEFKGDTLVEDVLYKKCIVVMDNDTTVVSLVRENLDEKKVYTRLTSNYKDRIPYNSYAFIDNGEDEYLLYDFTNILSTPVWKNGEWNVDCAKSGENINVGGTQCRQTGLYSTDGNLLYMIIEGVGFVNCLGGGVSYGAGTVIDFPGDDMATALSTAYSRFIRLVDYDGNVLFQSPLAGIDEIAADKSSFAVEVNGGAITVRTDGEGAVEVIDLTGRAVATAGIGADGVAQVETGRLTGGVYIVRVKTAQGIASQKIVI